MRSLFFIMFFGVIFSLNAQVSIKLKPEQKAIDNIKLLMDYLNSQRIDALNQGNYVLSQNFSDLYLYVSSLLEQTDMVLNKTLDKTDNILKQNLYSVEKIVNDVNSLKNETDLSLKTSIQDICNKFKFLCDEKNYAYSLSYINGQVINFKDDDFYLDFKGTAINLQSEIKCSLKINNNWTELQKYSLDGSVNQVRFKIDNKLIKHSFDDLNNKHLDYELNIGPKGKKAKKGKNIKYKGNLILMPKFPFKAELTQFYITDTLIFDNSYVKRQTISQSRPPYRLESYTNQYTNFTLEHDEVFKELKFEPKKLKKGEVALIKDVNRWYGYDITCKHKLSNEGRKVEIESIVKLWTKDVAGWDRVKVDRDEKSKGRITDSDDPSLKIKLDLYYYKRTEKIKSEIININPMQDNPNNLIIGSNLSSLLYDNHKNYSIKIKKNDTISSNSVYFLTSENPILSLNSYEIRSFKNGNRIQVDVVSKL
jgi:hypothetical protein